MRPLEHQHVDQRTKARITSPLNHCEEAASDLERFLAHAAADANDRTLHSWLYDAAKAVGAIPIELREALVSVEAFAEIGGTAGGVLRRAALEGRLGLGGRSDWVIRQEVDDAFTRALSAYDTALEEVVKAPQPFVDLLLEQRKTLAHLHRDLAAQA